MSKFDYVNNLIQELVETFNYKSLPTVLSSTVRGIYQHNCDLHIDTQLKDSLTIYTSDGNILAHTTERIVIGDYGAYYEIKPEAIVRERLENKKGQEYRFKNPAYKNKVKYYWLNPKGFPDVKIYYQRRTVSYADYKPDMIYISCFDEDIYAF